MPVLGHAFVGVATALCAEPGDAPPSALQRSLRAWAWAPALVGLAYLPDIAGELLALAGVAQARLVGHSVIFGAIAAGAITPALSALGSVSLLRAALITFGSILGHDLLDLLQATDRMPLWPWSERLVGIRSGLIPGRSLTEAAVFAPLLGLVLLLRWSRGRRAPRQRRRAAAGWALTAALAFFAVVVHKVRDLREDKYEAAARSVRQQRYAETLELLEQAGRWPRTSRPERSDYLRAEAYAGLGDHGRAERYYLRAYAADPTYFWVVVDLAELYASSQRPADARRRLAAPYLARLRRDFPEQPELPRVLARIERKLAEPRDGDRVASR
jgi:tetratricopeptide (TPR) repeat protein